MCASQGHKPRSITKDGLSFVEQEYPLVRLFEYGNDILIYDAKPHFAGVISRTECDVLVDFLCFIYLSINQVDIMGKIFDHRKNKRKYISYIHINKL